MEPAEIQVENLWPDHQSPSESSSYIQSKVIMFFFFFSWVPPPSLGLTLALSELGPTEKILTSCYIPATHNRHHFWTRWALQQTSLKLLLCMIPLDVCTPFLSVSLNHFPIPIYLYNILKQSASQEETLFSLQVRTLCEGNSHFIDSMPNEVVQAIHWGHDFWSSVH